MPIQSLARRLLPGPLAAAVSTWRTLRRNQAKDRWLREHHAVELTPRQIRDLRVLPGRAELLARLPHGGVVAEVGVAFGEFSRQIVDVCAPRTLYLVDLWDPAEPRYGSPALEATRERMRGELDAGTARIVRGLSWEGLASLPAASLDWVYLDAAHDFESVRRDLDAALPRMRPGGIIAGHDYTRWSSQGVNRFGVVEAVNAFCARERWELLYLTNESDRHLSFAIRGMDDP